MKKQNILVGSMISLMCLTGCNMPSFKKADNTPNTISYSKLKEIASDPYLDEVTNYAISGTKCDYPDGATYLKTMDSNLCAQNVGGVVEITNFVKSQVLSSNVIKNALNYSTYQQQFIFSSIVVGTKAPMIVYEEYDAARGANCIRYADSYGKVIRTEYNTENRTIAFRQQRKVGNETYFYYIDSYDNIPEDGAYFKYSIVDNKYVVSEVSLDDAKKVFNLNFNAPENYNDELFEIYDTNYKVIGYCFRNDELMNIYDEGKNYISSVNLESYGMGDSSLPMAFVGTKAYFFKYETYVEKVLEAGSEPTYKAYCLEIDFATGKVKFDEDYKYAVSEVINYEGYDENFFGYSVIKFTEILENRTLGKVQKYTIAKGKLDFNDCFVWDKFDGYSYRIDDNDILTSFNGVYYVINKKVRRALPNVSIISITSDKKVIYTVEEELWYCCDLADLRYNVYNLDGSRSFISSYLCNGERVSYAYNSDLTIRNADGIVVLSQYLNLAKEGLYISDKNVYVGKTEVVDSNLQIETVQVIGNYDSRVLEITYDDGSKQDMFFSMIETN